jgi:hypothetical protein
MISTDWHVVGTGDYNGDGKDDVLWRRDDGALTNWLAGPNGSFVSNDAHAFNHVPNFWVIQPKHERPWAVGLLIGNLGAKPALGRNANQARMIAAQPPGASMETLIDDDLAASAVRLRERAGTRR